MVNAHDFPMAALFQGIGLIVVTIGYVSFLVIDYWRRRP